MKLDELGGDYRVLIPNVLSIIAHLIILLTGGLATSGEHAHVIAITSSLIVLITFRSDIWLLSSNDDEVKKYVQISLYCVTFSTFFLVLSFAIFQSSSIFGPNVYFVFAAVSAALNEIVSAFWLRKKYLNFFIACKSLPFILFVFFVITNSAINIAAAWGVCLLIPSILFLLPPCLRRQFRIHPHTISSVICTYINFIKSSYSLVIGAFLTAYAGNLLAITIVDVYGHKETGIWVNVYRAISFPAIYFIVIYQYAYLQKKSQIKLQRTNSSQYAISMWLTIEKPLVFALSLLFFTVFFLRVVLFLSVDWVIVITIMSAIIYTLYKSYVQFMSTALVGTELNRILYLLAIIEIVAMLLWARFVDLSFLCAMVSIAVLTSILFFFSRWFITESVSRNSKKVKYLPKS